MKLSRAEFAELMRRHLQAHRLVFALHWFRFSVQGDQMQFSLPVGFAVPFTVSPVDSAGNPSKASLSGVTFSSSDTSICVVGADPSNPLGGTLTAVAAGTATLTGQGTATEQDGTQHPISGAVTIVVATVPPPATALSFLFGTPVPVVPPVPEPPK